jgi:hypothetical protein
LWNEIRKSAGLEELQVNPQAEEHFRNHRSPKRQRFWVSSGVSLFEESTMPTCLRNLLTILALLIGLLSFTGRASAEQPAVPRNTVLATNGTLLPAAGFVWVSDKAGDFRVRWVPGLKHPTQPNVLAGVKENSWRPAAGFKWVNKDSDDLRVVKAGPSDEELARGVLKALGALALHKASIPQRDDGVLKEIARDIARAGRDELIDSSLQDLFPDAKAVERASVRNLAILALDGRLSQDRDRVLAQLRKVNPEMADAVRAAEFLIRLAKAVEKD